MKIAVMCIAPKKQTAWRSEHAIERERYEWKGRSFIHSKENVTWKGNLFSRIRHKYVKIVFTINTLINEIPNIKIAVFICNIKTPVVNYLNAYESKNLVLTKRITLKHVWLFRLISNTERPILKKLFLFSID